uniref:Integrase, catalytic region, zinc finger, CCHC-type, peptidase aspartic, catalytic n=1 Tax=Tanacetum cinerariifolium TaxID=118510 RepID=A0A6L2L8F9_TANCI|nr:hypothetical protein [Tanacetum cinerariifolium]
MESMISLGQKNTLAEYMIFSGADNRPPMLDKDLYDSWKSIMELYMQNREHRRMILESIEHGPLIWPTIEENEVIRTRKYAELSVAEKIQADCDMKEINIILQGDDLIYCLNKAMAFLTAVASSKFPSTNNQLRTSSNLRNQTTIQDDKVTVQYVQGRQGQSYSGTVYKSNATSSGGTIQVDRQGLLNATTVKVKDIWLGNAISLSNQGMQHDNLPNNAAFQTEDLDTYYSDCDDISNAKAVLMTKISNYGSNVISELPHSETYLNDMENQSIWILLVNVWNSKISQHRVWNHMKSFIGIHIIPSDLSSIVDFLIPLAKMRSARSVGSLFHVVHGLEAGWLVECSLRVVHFFLLQGSDGYAYPVCEYVCVVHSGKIDHEKGNENDFKGWHNSEFPGYTSFKGEEDKEEEEKMEEEEEKEESKKKGSEEALEIGSNSETPGYVAFDNEAELDLEFTARSEPKCKEMEDTCESSVRPKPDSS